MGYDFEVKEDTLVHIEIHDHETGKGLFKGSVLVKKGQKIDYEIYPEVDGALRKR